MKRYYTAFIALLAFSAVNAQTLIDPPNVKDNQPRNGKQQTRLNETSRWINYGQTVYEAASLKDFFRVYLFPDSTVQLEYSNGWGFVSKHSLGQVFDPTAPNIMLSADGDVNIGPWMSYTLDSIAIPYRYFRFQDLQKDTVRVQVYRGTKITTQENTGWSSGASYATVNYSTTTFMGSDPDLSIEFLIDYNDTAQGSLRKFIQFPVGWNMSPDELAAVVVTYFPGNPYNFGDTIDTYLDVPPTNPINAFIVYEYRDRDKLVEQGYYNNELVANSTIRYNYNTNNWNGQYIPGTAWTAGFYHMDAFFRITYDADALSIDNLERPRLVLYPNPSNNSVYVQTGSEAFKTITVYNALGQIVLQKDAEFGHQGVELETENLPNGVYSVQTMQNGAMHSARLIKQ